MTIDSFLSWCILVAMSIRRKRANKGSHHFPRSADGRSPAWAARRRTPRATRNEFTPEEASAAQQEGACHDREHMRRIGKIGGQNKKSLPATKTTTHTQLMNAIQVTYPITEADIQTRFGRYVGLTAETPQQYKVVQAALSTCATREPRSKSSARSSKADSLEYGKKVDAAAKFLTAQIEVIEAPLKASKAAADRKKKAIEVVADAAPAAPAQEGDRHHPEVALCRAFGRTGKALGAGSCGRREVGRLRSGDAEPAVVDRAQWKPAGSTWASGPRGLRPGPV